MAHSSDKLYTASTPPHDDHLINYGADCKTNNNLFDKHRLLSENSTISVESGIFSGLEQKKVKLGNIAWATPPP